MTRKLNKRQVQTVTKPGRYWDAFGLALQVSAAGGKYWMQRLTIHGRRRDLGLGNLEIMSLDEARDAAFENYRKAKRGGDPLADRAKAVAMPTFGEAAEAVIELHGPTWKAKRAVDTFRKGITDHCASILNRPVNGVSSADILGCLTPIWTVKAKTAIHLRGHIAAVMTWAIAEGHRSDDPMAAVRAALPKNNRTVEHHRTVSHTVLGKALAHLRKVNAFPTVPLSIEFAALTAARSGEVRGATWDEIDPEAATWTIPATRMKMSTAHRVPLSPRAMAILEEVREVSGGVGLVFPSARGGMHASNILTRAIDRSGLKDSMTVHGLRSSFRDWCAETGKPREIAEAALAHTVKGVEAAYMRSDLFDRRRTLMDQWAAYLTGSDNKVVHFGRR